MIEAETSRRGFDNHEEESNEEKGVSLTALNDENI